MQISIKVLGKYQSARVELRGTQFSFDFCASKLEVTCGKLLLSQPNPEIYLGKLNSGLENYNSLKTIIHFNIIREYYDTTSLPF